MYCLLSIYSILSVLSACKASVEVLNCNLPVIIAPPLYRCELEELPSWSSVRNIMSVSTVNQENNFHSKASALNFSGINEKHLRKETFS